MCAEGTPAPPRSVIGSTSRRAVFFPPHQCPPATKFPFPHPVSARKPTTTILSSQEVSNDSITAREVVQDVRRLRASRIWAATTGNGSVETAPSATTRHSLPRNGRQSLHILVRRATRVFASPRAPKDQRDGTPPDANAFAWEPAGRFTARRQKSQKLPGSDERKLSARPLVFGAWPRVTRGVVSKTAESVPAHRQLSRGGPATCTETLGAA